MDNLIIDGYEYVWNEKGFYENLSEDAIYDIDYMWGAYRQHYGYTAMGWLLDNSKVLLKFIVNYDANIEITDLLRDEIQSSNRQCVIRIGMDKDTGKIIGGLWPCQ